MRRSLQCYRTGCHRKKKIIFHFLPLNFEKPFQCVHNAKKIGTLNKLAIVNRFDLDTQDRNTTPSAKITREATKEMRDVTKLDMKNNFAHNS